MSELIVDPQYAAGSPEWHALRRTGIGGSDAAAAIGMSRWKTPLQLYLEKIGESETTENEYMRWGTILEPVVRQEYCNQTGRTVVTPGQLRHPTRNFAFINVDGIADESRLYEGKTARTSEGWGEPGTDEVPDEYMLQTQHGMAVTGLEVADIAVLIGGSDFRIYTIASDPELQELLLDNEEEFWVNHVLARVPPKAVRPDDVRRLWRVSSGKSLTADDDIDRVVTELSNVTATIKALDEYSDSLKAAVQFRMQDAAELIASDGTVLATWKNINAAQKFDVQSFQDQYPDIYSKFLREPATQRRLLIKRKGTPCLPQSPLSLPQNMAD